MKKKKTASIRYVCAIIISIKIEQESPGWSGYQANLNLFRSWATGTCYSSSHPEDWTSIEYACGFFLITWLSIHKLHCNSWPPVSHQDHSHCIYHYLLLSCIITTQQPYKEDKVFFNKILSFFPKQRFLLGDSNCIRYYLWIWSSNISAMYLWSRIFLDKIINIIIELSRTRKYILQYILITLAWYKRQNFMAPWIAFALQR